MKDMTKLDQEQCRPTTGETWSSFPIKRSWESCSCSSWSKDCFRYSEQRLSCMDRQWRRWSRAPHRGTRRAKRNIGNELNWERCSLPMGIKLLLSMTLSPWQRMPRVIVHSLCVLGSKCVPDQPCLTTYLWWSYFCRRLNWDPLSVPSKLNYSFIFWNNSRYLKWSKKCYCILFTCAILFSYWPKFIILTNQWTQLFQRDLILLSAILVMNMQQLDWL